MTARRLYIDIDGVINAFRRGPYTIHLIADPENETDQVYIHMDSEAVTAFLAQFDEVVWASSWVNYPALLNQLERTLGLPVGGFERINLDLAEYKASATNSSGKASAVARHYDANPMPSLWIDDDLGPADRKMASTRDIELHAPDPAIGAYNYMFKFGLGL